VILDAGFLISVDRSERNAHTLLTAAVSSGTSLHTTEPVVAQVWRNGARQARLAAFLKTVTIHPLADGRAVGKLLAHAGTTDVVDAHLVVMAVRLGSDILTADPGDLTALSEVLGPASPRVHAWP